MTRESAIRLWNQSFEAVPPGQGILTPLGAAALAVSDAGWISRLFVDSNITNDCIKAAQFLEFWAKALREETP
jgi:hypothetical protein